MAEELYESARRLRVFTAKRIKTGLERVITVVTLPSGEIEKQVAGGKALLE